MILVVVYFLLSLYSAILLFWPSIFLVVILSLLVLNFYSYVNLMYSEETIFENALQYCDLCKIMTPQSFIHCGKCNECFPVTYVHSRLTNRCSHKKRLERYVLGVKIYAITMIIFTIIDAFVYTPQIIFTIPHLLILKSIESWSFHDINTTT
jgi:hypothetical protein